MREIHQVFLDRETGEVSGSCELVPDADWDQRASELARRASEIEHSLPGDLMQLRARHRWLACDGCAAITGLDFSKPELPDGWVTEERGDFCPSCRPARGA